MGLLSKLFGERQHDFLTDDERELREYEENVYRAESGVAEHCHAELIITSSLPAADGRTVIVGSVTEGTFRTGDKVDITLRNGQHISSEIIAITLSAGLSGNATEGQKAEFLLGTSDSKLIKRNDIIKKIINEAAHE